MTITATDTTRLPRSNARGLGRATSAQLWRLNAEGMLELRGVPAEPLLNMQCGHVIAGLVDAQRLETA